MVVPTEPGVALEVVESETGFQFPVVVFDAPADLDQAHQLRQGCVLGQGGEREVGRFGSSSRLFGQQPCPRQHTVLMTGESCGSPGVPAAPRTVSASPRPDWLGRSWFRDAR